MDIQHRAHDGSTNHGVAHAGTTVCATTGTLRHASRLDLCAASPMLLRCATYHNSDPDQPHGYIQHMQGWDCMPEIGLLISMFLHPQGPACTQDLGSLPSQLARLWCALHVSVEAWNVCTQLMALCFLPCRLLRIQELHTRNRSLRLSATVCCQGIRQRKEPCTGKRQRFVKSTGRQQNRTGWRHSRLVIEPMVPSSHLNTAWRSRKLSELYANHDDTKSKQRADARGPVQPA